MLFPIRDVYTHNCRMVLPSSLLAWLVYLNQYSGDKVNKWAYTFDRYWISFEKYAKVVEHGVKDGSNKAD